MLGLNFADMDSTESVAQSEGEIHVGLGRGRVCLQPYQDPLFLARNQEVNNYLNTRVYGSNLIYGAIDKISHLAILTGR